jgi:hypothetical protein
MDMKTTEREADVARVRAAGYGMLEEWGAWTDEQFKSVMIDDLV